jgi:hypothetical protein
VVVVVVVEVVVVVAGCAGWAGAVVGGVVGVVVAGMTAEVGVVSVALVGDSVAGEAADGCVGPRAESSPAVAEVHAPIASRATQVSTARGGRATEPTYP